ncbi:MAG: hypothetical protein ABIO55_11295 [Ginsengibacter sp.]
MTNWLSKKIIKHFKENAIAQINADPSGVVKKHFKKVIEFLNKKYSDSIKELYWIGSYKYDTSIVTYFKECDKVTLKILDNLPFARSTAGEDIIDVLIGKTDSNQWFVSFFSDQINLYSDAKFIDSILIKMKTSLFQEIKVFESLI